LDQLSAALIAVTENLSLL